jgi:hypothetical protein
MSRRGRPRPGSWSRSSGWIDRWDGCWWWTMSGRRTPDPEGVVFVFDGGTLDETDVVGMVLPDEEIRSAGFYTLDEVREQVKPLLADRIAIPLRAVEQGATALCDHGCRIT